MEDQIGRLIRVLHVLGSAQAGGTEIMTARLLRGMSRRFRNDLCFLSEAGPVSEELALAGFAVCHLPLARLPQLPRVAAQFVRVLQRGRYDVIHLYGLKANSLGRVLGRLCGQPAILGGLRSEYPAGIKKEWSFWLDRATFWLGLGYVSNSQAACDSLAAHGYPRHKLWVIQSGIDAAPFHSGSPEQNAADRERFGLRSYDFPVITCVGNLRTPKGHTYLLTALPELTRAFPHLHVLLFGDGPLRGELEAETRGLDLEDHVRFMGTRAQHDIVAGFSLANIAVFPSLQEGLPTAVLEAMAAGCPVVATRVGGTPELVVDGITGILVDPSNPKALASALRQLLTDPALCRRMGAAGRERAAACFSIERMVHEYEALYMSIVGLP